MIINFEQKETKMINQLQSDYDPRSPRNKEDDCMNAFSITQGTGSDDH